MFRVNRDGCTINLQGVMILFWAFVSQAAAMRGDVRPEEPGQECWETRCQGDHWHVKGCEQYGMTETKRVPCGGGGGGVDGGHVYTCCRPTDGGEPSPQPLHRHPCGHNGSEAECGPTWSRPFGRDCELYDDVADGEHSQCAEGYEFICCSGNEEDDDHKDDDHKNDDHKDDDHKDDDHKDDDHKNDNHKDDDHKDDDHKNDDHKDDDHKNDDHKDDEDEDDNYNQSKKGRMTFFYPAVGACGIKNCANDLVAAVGPYYFHTPNPNNDPVCGKNMKIVDPHSSKSVVVKVVDKCGGCSKDDIMLSPAAFKKITQTAGGWITVKWDFV